MKIGFTGTREGMNDAQLRQLGFVLKLLFVAMPAGDHWEFHHGCAPGSDRRAWDEAKRYGFAERQHPIKAGQSPLVRDREIVAAVDVLIAAPLTDCEVLRSGTWATIRYMQDAGKPVIKLSRGKT